MAVASGKSAAISAAGGLYTWGADSGFGELGWIADIRKAKKMVLKNALRKFVPYKVSLKPQVRKAFLKGKRQGGQKKTGGEGSETKGGIDASGGASPGKTGKGYKKFRANKLKKLLEGKKIT